MQSPLSQASSMLPPLPARSNVLFRNCSVVSLSASTDETIKMNQCMGVYIENSLVSGSQGNAIDYVAVQFGHLLRSEVRNSDYCVYFKVGCDGGDGVLLACRRGAGVVWARGAGQRQGWCSEWGKGGSGVVQAGVQERGGGACRLRQGRCRERCRRRGAGQRQGWCGEWGWGAAGGVQGRHRGDAGAENGQGALQRRCRGDTEQVKCRDGACSRVDEESCQASTFKVHTTALSTARFSWTPLQTLFRCCNRVAAHTTWLIPTTSTTVTAPASGLAKGQACNTWFPPSSITRHMISRSVSVMACRDAPSFTTKHMISRSVPCAIIHGLI